MVCDIESIKRKMLVKYPFFGSVVTNVDYKENNNISTAGTDGKTIYYNKEFLSKISNEEQVFVFSHEVCHIAFNHILRSEGKESDLWNIATDGVINQFLKRDGLKLIDGVVDIEEAINYDAEQLYEKLLHEKKQNKQENKEQNDGQGGNGQSGNNGQNNNSSNNEQDEKDKEQSSSQSQNSNGESQNQKQVGNKQNSNSGDSSQEKNENKDVGHDTHSMWEEAVKKHKEQKEKFENNDEENSKKENDKELENKQKETEKLGEKESFNKNREVKKKELEDLKESLLSGAMAAGDSTNGDVRKVEDIGYAKPIIDWRYVLREAIKYDVDWSYKNATIEDGVVSANLEEQPMPETEIVLDTSNSISEQLLKGFLRECKNILKQSRVKVGCFDYKFYGFHDIRTEKDIEDMNFEGYGGTNFNAAVNAFTRRVENKIIFTDGKAPMPSMSLDAIWIVFGGKRINPDGGKVIYIDADELKRMYSYEEKVRKRTR